MSAKRTTAWPALARKTMRAKRSFSAVDTMPATCLKDMPAPLASPSPPVSARDSAWREARPAASSHPPPAPPDDSTTKKSPASSIT